MSQSAAGHWESKPRIVRHDFADVNGVRIHYAVAQSAEPAEGTRQHEARLILFLHGFPEFWYAWRRQLADFAPDFVAVAPDMRGYNLSSKPAAVSEYAIGKLVNDVKALVEHLSTTHHLNTKSCILVGHDWGGIVAWAVAMMFPEIVEKLVIINAPHPKIFERELRENPAQQEASEYMLLFRSSQAEAMLSADSFAIMQQTILDKGVAQGYFSDADRKAYLAAWSQPGALTGGLNYYRAAEVGPSMGPGQGALTLAQEFPSFEVKAPTLMIWGERDPYILTGCLNGSEVYVPNLTIRRIPDATHWVVHEKSGLVNSLIREFVGE